MLEETIELSNPQFDFLTSENKHTGFVAGFGSGKSYIGTLKSLMKIIDRGIPKTAYYLPTYGDIRDIAFDGFPLVAEQLGYKSKLNRTDKEFLLLDRNKKEIGKTIFRNMSEPESIVGYQVGYTLIDETDILKKEIMDKAFKKILGRNRLILPVQDQTIIDIYNKTGIEPEGTYYHNKIKKLCWVNCIDVAGTPEGYKWFYDRFVTKFKKGTDRLIKASTYSNLHNLPDDFIETLRAEYPEALFEAYVNGNFVNLTSGNVYPYFDRNEHNSNAEVTPYETLYIGQDFNYSACISIVFVKRENQLIAVDEIISKDTKSIVENLQHQYPNNVIQIYPDASGNNNKTNSSDTDLSILRNAYFTIFVNHANPRIKDRINIVNNCFEKKKVLVNTKKCIKLTEALEQQAYDVKTGEPEKSNDHPSKDDYNDAFGYCLSYLFPITSGHITAKLLGI